MTECARGCASVYEGERMWYDRGEGESRRVKISTFGGLGKVEEGGNG